jgi:hypothetical protein
MQAQQRAIAGVEVQHHPRPAAARRLGAGLAQQAVADQGADQRGHGRGAEAELARRLDPAGAAAAMDQAQQLRGIAPAQIRLSCASPHLAPAAPPFVREGSV